MTRPHVPEAVLTAAHDRARARSDGDWAEADRLRGVIEAAGWRIVDRGTDFALSLAQAPDVRDAAGRIRYGSGPSVPSRLEEPPSGLATVVLVATDHPAALERTLSGLRDHAPTGTSIVVVADAPSPGQSNALESLEADARDGTSAVPVDVVWTSQRLGHSAAVDIGIRRAGAPVVILLCAGISVTGDLVTPLARALDEPTVAIVGARGATSSDLRHFEDAPGGAVAVLVGEPVAFRRADYVERGPLDERFGTDRHLLIWWSLVLRDMGPGGSPRLAVQLVDLPFEELGTVVGATPDPGDRDRQTKRDGYRILDRFGGRPDLAVPSAEPG